MAPTRQTAPREVIDLTTDDDDDAVRQVQPRPPAPPPALENGTTNRVANGFVDFVPPGDPPSHGSAHAHPYAPPVPAQGQPFYRRHAPSTPAYAPSPPAKRQKLSEPPRGMVDDEQVITKSVGIHLSSYARNAVEELNNKNVDENKLKAEVRLAPPPQRYRESSVLLKMTLTTSSQTDPKSPYRPIRKRNSTDWAPS